MKFKHDLTSGILDQVNACNLKLGDPARLRALERTGLMDAPSDEAFDRLARVAAEALGVPLTIISLVTDDRQFFMAGHGLPSPFDKIRGVPIDESICRYTLNNTEIVAGDTSQHQLLSLHPTTEPWHIGAFIAIPMVTYDGHVLGAFCAVDWKPREWTDSNLQFMREMTKSVMTEIRLREQIAELDEEKRLREHFIASLTHDLLNPIGVAKGGAEVLMQKLEHDPKQLRLAQMIKNSATRAESMIRGLLDVYSIKAGQPLLIQPTPTNFRLIVDSVRDSLLGPQRECFRITGNIDVDGHWDANALIRIIDNLLSNAFKYGTANAPVCLNAVADATHLHFTVFNQGTPIPENALNSIFKAFNRTQSARDTNTRGWGIGLTLVKALTLAHKGEILAESSEHGTSFKVSLPR